MLYFRACPKCHGDVVFQRDLYGNYLECLQCGLTIDSRTPRDQMRKESEGAPAAA